MSQDSKKSFQTPPFAHGPVPNEPPLPNPEAYQSQVEAFFELGQNIKEEELRQQQELDFESEQEVVYLSDGSTESVTSPPASISPQSISSEGDSLEI